MTARLLIAVTAVALAGLLFGFDTAVIAGVTDAVRSKFHLSPAALGATVASSLWGTLAGALAAGWLGQRIGARNGLVITAILYLASGVGCALAWDLRSLIGFRILSGLAVGLSSVLAPVYLAEIAPAKQRGRIVGSFQVALVVGILLAYLSNYAVVQLVADPDLVWRAKLGATALPAILFLGVMALVPPSPRWLSVLGRTREAEAASLLLYGTRTWPDLPPAVAPALRGSGRIWQEARRPLLIAMALAAMNQLTGINAVLYYLNDIFAAAGFGRMSADLQAIAVGSTNLFFTVLAMTFIDRVGRRPMLMFGALGMAAMLCLTALIMDDHLPKSLLLPVLVVFVASFAMSQGAIIWVYISEILPDRFRAAGQGIGSATIWLFDALVAQLFPILSAASPSTPFVVFAVAMIVQWFVVRRYMPETKGVSLTQIEALFDGRAKS